MGRILIVYRREDSAPEAGRLYDDLVERFGPHQVFMDIDSILAGADFGPALPDWISESDIVLIVIGNRWLSTLRCRLDDPNDGVRVHLESAVKKSIRVIPVLVHDAKMPSEEALPEALADLAGREAVSLSSSRWHTDLGRLIESIERSGIGPPGPAMEPHEHPSTTEQRWQQVLMYLEAQQWHQAAELLGEIVADQPNYRDAAARLEVAKRQAELAYHYASGRDAHERKDWSNAISHFEPVVGMDSGYRDAARFLDHARRQRRVAELYVEAHELYQEHSWRSVLNILLSIHSIDPNFNDPDGLESIARGALADAEHLAPAMEEFENLVARYNAGPKSVEHDDQLRYELTGLRGKVLGMGQLLVTDEGKRAHQELTRAIETGVATLKEVRTRAEASQLVTDFHALMRGVESRRLGLDEIRPLYDKLKVLLDRVRRAPRDVANTESAMTQLDTTLRHALTDIEREAAALLRRGSAEMPVPNVDLVHFSVTSPSESVPGGAFVLDVWAHLETQRSAAVQRAREHAEVKEIAVSTKGPVRVARGTTLSVRLRIDELLDDQNADTILWDGEIGNATFLVRVPAAATPGPKPGVVSIYVDGLRVIRMYFVIRIVAVEQGAVRRARDLESLSIREERYLSAFASYAHADRDAVLARIQGIQKVAPHMTVFLDALSLRSGQDWERALRRVIPMNDVFYLFWSEHAKQSTWVDKEWRCALETRGIDFIDPVPLQPPEVVPPPPELAGKHFNDWVLSFMSQTNPKAVSMPALDKFRRLFRSFRG